MSPDAEIRALLCAAFSVALQTDASDADALRASLDAFRPLVHSARHGTPLLDSELLAYKWRPWVQRARQYLERPDDPASFAIVQWLPAEPDAKTQQIKVFLRAERRMPTPVTFCRDPVADGALRIEATSL